MGVSWSSMSECLGDFSNGSAAARYGRVPPSHRVEPSRMPSAPVSASLPISPGGSGSSPTDTPALTRDARSALRQRCISDDKLSLTPSSSPRAGAAPHLGIGLMGGGGGGGPSMAAASRGAAMAPLPPPLVPDPNAVYNLVEDETEDVCPTCLEIYADDNPKIGTTCGHAFHLQCIVAWETRSGSKFCPICAKEMDYVEAESSLHTA